ncbi:MAG: CHAT domain-containing protein [Bacteroidetes bacterium]|nr:MAG: CHAT domain-containing protein [Bacteroidota bacterium]
MQSPVILLAFSNDNDDHLALLDAERRAISDHLVPLESQQYLQLHSEPSARIKDLTRYFTLFKDRISIFHYAGHAASTKIFLQEGDADAEGLANLLATQSNIKLVFLNGCSTREQVKKLIDLGVPSVIATSVPVSDPAAKDFADNFYKALATEHSIEEAFTVAASAYQMGSGTEVKIHRSLDIDEEGDSTDEMPWGLYVSKDKQDVLQWKIPLKSAASFIIRDANLKYQPGTSLNKKLVETIANSIMPYAETIRDLIEEAKRKRREPKMRDLRVAVIDAFPTPVGTHLRKLLQAETINTDRLQKIVNVYSIAAQFLAYILLAQLWDEKHHNNQLEIPEEHKNNLKRFLGLSSEEVRGYNYINLIRTLGDIFENNKVEPFIAEFSELRKEFRADSEFRKACSFLEELKVVLKTKVSSDEVESFCVQAEDHLCEVFKHIGFSTKYTLMTIKRIDLIKERHKTPEYLHNLVILDKLTAAFGELDDVLYSTSFTENESVILLYDEDDVSPNLNLSPFLIDENALSGQKNSKLFFYHHQQDSGVHYLLTDNLKDTMEVNQDRYGQIKDLFDRFYREVVEGESGATVVE